MKSKKISSINELAEIAEEILTQCVQKDTAVVLALQGDLGAGKTAFTKELARNLDVAEVVTSPTFVIMKSYGIPKHAFFKTLIHIDAYRIESDDEMRVLGFQELLQDPTNLVCIEWSEKIQNLLPKEKMTVSLELKDDGTRDIRYGN